MRRGFFFGSATSEKNHCNSSWFHFVVGWLFSHPSHGTSVASLSQPAPGASMGLWCTSIDHDPRPMPQWSGPDRWFDQKAHHRSKAPSPSRPSPYPRTAAWHRDHGERTWNLSVRVWHAQVSFVHNKTPAAFARECVWSWRVETRAEFLQNTKIYKNQNLEICVRWWILLDSMLLYEITTPLWFSQRLSRPNLKCFVELDDIGMVLRDPIGMVIFNFGRSPRENIPLKNHQNLPKISIQRKLQQPKCPSAAWSGFLP